MHKFQKCDTRLHPDCKEQFSVFNSYQGAGNHPRHKSGARLSPEFPRLDLGNQSLRGQERDDTIFKNTTAPAPLAKAQALESEAE